MARGHTLASVPSAMRRPPARWARRRMRARPPTASATDKRSIRAKTHPAGRNGTRSASHATRRHAPCRRQRRRDNEIAHQLDPDEEPSRCGDTGMALDHVEGGVAQGRKHDRLVPIRHARSADGRAVREVIAAHEVRPRPVRVERHVHGGGHVKDHEEAEQPARRGHRGNLICARCWSTPGRGGSTGRPLTGCWRWRGYRSRWPLTCWSRRRDSSVC